MINKTIDTIYVSIVFIYNHRQKAFLINNDLSLLNLNHKFVIQFDEEYI